MRRQEAVTSTDAVRPPVIIADSDSLCPQNITLEQFRYAVAEIVNPLSYCTT
jgi:hypothetical protein